MSDPQDRTTGWRPSHACGWKCVRCGTERRGDPATMVCGCQAGTIGHALPVDPAGTVPLTREGYEHLRIEAEAKQQAITQHLRWPPPALLKQVRAAVGKWESPVYAEIGDGAALNAIAHPNAAPEPAREFNPASLQVTEVELPAPTELRPPPEHAEKPLHWVEHPAFLSRGMSRPREVAAWHGDHWGLIGDDGRHSPKDMVAAGWRYLGPAEWRGEPLTHADWDKLETAVRGQRTRIAELEVENATLRAHPWLWRKPDGGVASYDPVERVWTNLADPETLVVSTEAVMAARIVELEARFAATMADHDTGARGDRVPPGRVGAVQGGCARGGEGGGEAAITDQTADQAREAKAARQ